MMRYRRRWRESVALIEDQFAYIEELEQQNARLAAALELDPTVSRTKLEHERMSVAKLREEMALDARRKAMARHQ